MERRVVVLTSYPKNVVGKEKKYECNDEDWLLI